MNGLPRTAPGTPGSLPANATASNTAGSPTPTGAGLPGRSDALGNTGTATGTGSAAGGAAGTGSATTASERIHVIASGDTFEALAAKYFGNKNQWKAIASANPLVEPTALRVGQKIKIPASATALSVSDAPSRASGSSASGPAAATASAPAGSSIHVVAKGDNPSSISRKYYGTDRYWREILSANKGATEKNLRIGQKLVIPAKSTIVGAENVGSSAN